MVDKIPPNEGRTGDSGPFVKLVKKNKGTTAVLTLAAVVLILAALG